MNIKHMALTCAILITAYTTLGLGFQSVNGQKPPAKPAVSTATAKAKSSAPKRQTWGRYNGSGMNGGYQYKATKVLKRMTEWTPEAWKKHVNTKGPFWKR